MQMEALMHRTILRAAALAASLFLSSYAIAAQFSNPQDVNLLERWNPDGTYTPWTMAGTWGNTISATEGLAVASIDYSAWGMAWRINKPGLDATKTATIRYTFSQPMLIDELRFLVREANHGPTNYTWSDQNGVIVTYTQPQVGDTGSSWRMPAGTYSDTFAPRLVSYLEWSTTLDNTTGVNADPNFYHLLEVSGFGAFAAPGQAVHKDGTYNLLYDSNAHYEPSMSSGASAMWSDHLPGSNGAKPSPSAGFATYDLGATHYITGAFLTQYDTARYLSGASLDVSLDGVNWTRVWTDTDTGGLNLDASVAEWHFRGEAAPRNLGYIVLDAPYNTDFPQARYVRLNWNDHPLGGAGIVEITEFQIFGFIPEPGSAMVLAAGAMMLGVRRRP
jgi:hypothetical protein